MKELANQRNQSGWDRREFVSALSRTIGSSLFLAAPGLALAKNLSLHPQALTVQQVIDLIIREIPGGKITNTVDTLKAGRPEQTVKGIGTTTFATAEVIKKAAAMGINFLIVHEPTYYGHLDETEWLAQDDVYQFKRDLLQKHGMAVWRFHDYWHTHRPDGVMMGVLTALGWEKNYDSAHPSLITLPGSSVREVVAHVKEKLGISTVKVIGNPDQPVRRIALLPGASGGKGQIALLQKEKPDLVLVGELNEWETAEYVRDARSMGKPLALVVLGHALSEEPGMQWLVGWLKPKVPGIPVTHIPAQDPFRWM